jgi:hypothetical protein
MVTKKNVTQDGLLLAYLIPFFELQILYGTGLNVKEVGKNLEKGYVGIPEYPASHSRECGELLHILVKTVISSQT